MEGIIIVGRREWEDLLQGTAISVRLVSNGIERSLFRWCNCITAEVGVMTQLPIYQVRDFPWDPMIIRVEIEERLCIILEGLNISLQ